MEIDNQEIQETDKNENDICNKILKINDNHNRQELEELDRRYDVAVAKIKENKIGTVDFRDGNDDVPILLYDYITREKGGDWSQIPSKEILQANNIVFRKRPLSIEVLTHPFTLKCVNHFIENFSYCDYDNDYVHYYNYYKNTDNEIIKDIQNRIKEKIDFFANK